MATINPTNKWLSKGVLESKWEGLTSSGDTIGAISTAQLSDKSVQITGTFASAVINLQGSNFSATGPWTTMVDPQGNAMSALTSGTVETVLDNVRFIRPLPAGATGGSDIDVVIISRGPK